MPIEPLSIDRDGTMARATGFRLSRRKHSPSGRSACTLTPRAPLFEAAGARRGVGRGRTIWPRVRSSSARPDPPCMASRMQSEARQTPPLASAAVLLVTASLRSPARCKCTRPITRTLRASGQRGRVQFNAWPTALCKATGGAAQRVQYSTLCTQDNS